MESIKSKKFKNFDEQKLNERLNVNGGGDVWGFVTTVDIGLTGDGSLSVTDNGVDRVHIGKGTTG